MAFLFTNIVSDMAQNFSLIFVFVFLGKLNSIDLSSWIAPLLAFMMLIFLEVLV